MYTNVDTKFPTEWWEKRSVVDPTRKNPQEVLKIKQHGFNKYARDQKEKLLATRREAATEAEAANDFPVQSS